MKKQGINEEMIYHMNEKELKRVHCIRMAVAGKMTAAEAAQALRPLTGEITKHGQVFYFMPFCWI